MRSPVPGTTTAAGHAAADVTASLDCVLRPRRVAVIGASRTPNTIGHEIVSNLVGYGFTGTVFPVNPKADSIRTLKTYPTIGAVPDPVDMAVITVPKQHVLAVAEECGQAGVRGLTVISAGFREVGGEGVERERQLMEVVRRHRMRMIGPNCMGVLNADPAVSMNATFAPSMPPFGRAGFVSQSGAMGLSVLDYAKEYGIGISQFVSMGNKPDVSGNDLLLHWEHDPSIGLVLMYVENFGNPRKFLEIARRMTRTKPIIVVKSGRSKVGARAASSHTGALAASDALVDAMLSQAGVMRAESVEELFDLAMAFSGERTPRSRRTAVVTNSGGPGILAADALERVAVELPELAPETVARLKPLFPEEASLRNPLDMIASATPPGYRAALDALLDDPNVDSALAIFVPPLGIRQADVAEAIASVAGAHPDKPVLAVLMGREGLPQGKAELHEVGVPAYIFPESAARALSALCRQREWVERPAPAVEDLRVDRDAARRLRRRRARGRAVAPGRGRVARAPPGLRHSHGGGGARAHRGGGGGPRGALRRCGGDEDRLAGDRAQNRRGRGEDRGRGRRGRASGLRRDRGERAEGGAGRHDSRRAGAGDGDGRAGDDRGGDPGSLLRAAGHVRPGRDLRGGAARRDLPGGADQPARRRRHDRRAARREAAGRPAWRRLPPTGAPSRMCCSGSASSPRTFPRSPSWT